MNELQYSKELLKCVRCGACKAGCPTYLAALDETMGARGRIAMLHALMEDRLQLTERLSEKIFSCLLCGACGDLCPTGIDILEVIYHGRRKLKSFYNRGRLLIGAARLSPGRMNSIFFILRLLQKIFYHPLYKKGKLPYIPPIATMPFKNTAQVYKNAKRAERVAVFAGCSVNYFYPHLGTALLNILLTRGYEVVVLKGEVCCGAPMRALGLEEEAINLAKKNVSLFSRVRASSILCMCPTCALTIKKVYPLLIGDSIERIMDVNEFFVGNDIAKGLKTTHRVVTYHDPCHLNYGLGVKDEPRHILKRIQGVEFIEMESAGGCCGFGGFFSINFKDLSQKIGGEKFKNIHNTGANTLVTSCPGCMMQFENIKRQGSSQIGILHMVEVIDEAMHK